jgi:hypothetical protein
MGNLFFFLNEHATITETNKSNEREIVFYGCFPLLLLFSENCQVLNLVYMNVSNNIYI